MKRILLFVCLLYAGVANAQDSVQVTISPQYRDLEYMGTFLSNTREMETLYDSIKVKFRVTSPPTGTTTTNITVYTVDWIILMRALKADVVAVKGGTTSRIEALLRAVSQTYLTNVLNGLDTTDGVDFISARVAGRLKLRRSQ